MGRCGVHPVPRPPRSNWRQAERTRQAPGPLSRHHKDMARLHSTLVILTTPRHEPGDPVQPQMIVVMGAMVMLIVPAILMPNRQINQLDSCHPCIDR
jgi:hypothetical protein